MKVAVIGSGAAAFGVFEGLSHSVVERLDHFDPGQETSDAFRPAGPPTQWRNRDTAQIYRQVRKNGGSGIPLPKSHFGDAPPRLNVSGKPRIWISNRPGGLTHFWGGTMLPFLHQDLVNWPFDRAQLDPFYKHIARVVGISGQDDGLSDLYGTSLVTRPPINPHPRISRLAAQLHGKHDGETQFTLGLNRTALETREDNPSCCVSCGECMIGCFRDSTFSTTKVLGRSDSRAAKANRIIESVWAIEPDSGIIRSGAQGSIQHGPYDKIFLAAGCLGSTEIVLRSSDIKTGVKLGDSFSINIPILSLGLSGSTAYGPHFGLANALMVLTDKMSGRCLAQAQIYPTVPHFWRSALPPALWRVASILGSPLRRQLHWVRMYLPPPDVNEYHLSLSSSGNLIAELDAPESAMASAKQILRQFSRALRNSGYKLLWPLLSAGGTSSHYAASLSEHERFGIRADSSWGSKVVVCDSSVWPETPVQSPTFTIMANAMRLASIYTSD